MLIIARWLLKEPHTISSLLIRMEKAGLISRRKTQGKGNSMIITLTEKGNRAYTQSFKRESIKHTMSCLSEEEYQQLSSSLEKLRDTTLESLAKFNNKLPFP
jgi:DNA-binding MarR family transcriptional regulator